MDYNTKNQLLFYKYTFNHVLGYLDNKVSIQYT